MTVPSAPVHELWVRDEAALPAAGSGETLDLGPRTVIGVRARGWHERVTAPVPEIVHLLPAGDRVIVHAADGSTRPGVIKESDAGKGTLAISLK